MPQYPRHLLTTRKPYTLSRSVCLYVSASYICICLTLKHVTSTDFSFIVCALTRQRTSLSAILRSMLIAPKPSSTPPRRTRSHAPNVTRRLGHHLRQSLMFLCKQLICTPACAFQDLGSADIIAKLRREINGLRSKLAKLNARDKEASGIARVAMVIDRVPRRCLWTLVSHQAQTA